MGYWWSEVQILSPRPIFTKWLYDSVRRAFLLGKKEWKRALKMTILVVYTSQNEPLKTTSIVWTPQKHIFVLEN
jgi:hypothetical protein